MVNDITIGTYAQMKRRAEDRAWRRDVMTDLPYGRLPWWKFRIVFFWM